MPRNWRRRARSFSSASSPRCRRPGSVTSSARRSRKLRPGAAGAPLRREADAREGGRVPAGRQLPVEQRDVLLHGQDDAGGSRAACSGRTGGRTQRGGTRQGSRRRAPPAQPRSRRLPAAPNISIDYAVMERASGVVVLSGDFGWSDIGSWKAVAEEFERDAHGNTSSGDVILSDCTNVHVQTDDRLVAAVGLNDVVIVDTPDAVLVCDRHPRRRSRTSSTSSSAAATTRTSCTAPSPALGHLYDAAGRPELQDQAHRGQAGRLAVAADAPPPQRALGGRQRHRAG